MAGQRSTVDEIVTEIRRNIGESIVAQSDIDSDSDLYKIMNRYVQSLPMKVMRFIRAQGAPIQAGDFHLDMWKQTWTSTTVNAADTLVVTQGSATVYLPSNMDDFESFYDTTYKREIDVVVNPEKSAEKIELLTTLPSGPPEAIEIRGNTTNTSWVREAQLYPAPPSSLTPTIRLVGWRNPASVSATTDYLDIDIKYEELVIVGVTAEILRKDDPNLPRFIEAENDLLLGLATSAKAA